MLVLAAFLLSGCIGVSAKKHGAGGPGTVPIKLCRQSKPAFDGIIDDFEDSNTQLEKKAGRDGYWFKANDPKGSTSEMVVDEPGADGSELAMHFTGVTVPGDEANDYWGAMLGANFSSQNAATYDASRYAGIAFKAKVGSPNATRSFRFKIGDVNTHKDGGICTACWNHWGRDITLTSEWKEYRVNFAGTEQMPGWGNPRPPAMLPDKLMAINFSVGPGATYDIWLDDIVFLDCQ
jgi:endoglucanase